MILCKNNDCIIAHACLRNQEYLSRKINAPKLNFDSEELVKYFESTEEGECKFYIERLNYEGDSRSKYTEGT